MQASLTKHLTTVGIEQGRNTLPQLALRAFGGEPCVLTKHGKPYAAIVPLEMVQRAQSVKAEKAGWLALRGTGKGLWGAQPAQMIAELRDEQ